MKDKHKHVTMPLDERCQNVSCPPEKPFSDDNWISVETSCYKVCPSDQDIIYGNCCANDYDCQGIGYVINDKNCVPSCPPWSSTANDGYDIECLPYQRYSAILFAASFLLMLLVLVTCKRTFFRRHTSEPNRFHNVERKLNKLRRTLKLAKDINNEDRGHLCSEENFSDGDITGPGILNRIDQEEERLLSTRSQSPSIQSDKNRVVEEPADTGSSNQILVEVDVENYLK